MFSCIIKGKRSDGKNRFVHHCETFPNPLKLCYDFQLHLFKSFPAKKLMALVLLSPGWCHGPNLRGLRRWWESWTGSLAKGKCGFFWQTMGRMTREFGSTWISSFLRRRFGSTPNCSIVNAQRLMLVFSWTKLNSSSRQQEIKRESETMEGDTCKTLLCVRTINSRLLLFH